MNFWIGLLIGLFVGANIGVLVAGLLFGAKKTEQMEESTSEQFTTWAMTQIRED